MNDVTETAGGAKLFIRFEGERVSTGDVTALLEAIVDQLKEDEITETKDVCAALGISPMIRDAALYRLKESDVDRFYIEALRPGSFEMLAVIAASTYFILDRTIGESIKAGYASSELHGQVKEWIARRIDEKMTRLAHSLPGHWRLITLRTSISTDDKSGTTTIVVPQHKQDEDRAPALGQLALPPPPRNHEVLP